MSYVYVAFTMGVTYDMHIMRILNKNLGETLQIDWHIKYIKPTPNIATNQNIPRNLFLDRGDSGNIYITGMYNNVGSVLKLQKRDSSLLYRVSFKGSADADGTTNGLTDITA